jgi:hypothetical protein
VRSGSGCLLAGQTAADSIEFQACVLSGFDGTSHSLSHECRHFDSALLHIQDHRAARGQLRL